MVGFSQLSPAQKEILNLINIEYLTPKQIAARRKTTIYAVYKTIRKIKSKGYKIGGTKMGVQNRGVTKTKTSASDGKNLHHLRLHNIHLSIDILHKTKLYSYRKKCQSKIMRTTFTAYDKHIDLYTEEGLCFYGPDVDTCMQRAIKYFEKVYAKVENLLGITIDKEGYLNKKWVRQHISREGDEIAQECVKEGHKMAIKDPEDGKTRMLIDASVPGGELEAVHPTKAPEDMKRYTKFVDDVVINKAPIPSELLQILVNDRQFLSEFSAQAKGYAAEIRNHRKVQEQQIKNQEEMNKLLRKLNNKLEARPSFLSMPSGAISSSQSSLLEYCR